MALLETVETDYITAYKARDEVKVAVLRLLKTAIKNKAVELKQEPDDAEVLDLIFKQVKQRKESIGLFSKAGRTDLVDREQLELEALNHYLPVQLFDDELATFVDEIVTKIGAKSMADMGKVMGALNARFKGRFDGKKASDLVRSRLTF